MVNVLLTPAFGELDRWPGRLLEAEDGTTVTTRTATSFAFRHPGTGHDFPNFRIVVTGTGFTYLDGDATGGTITRIVVQNAAAQTIATFTGFASNTIASDLANLFSNVFGSRAVDGEEVDGPGPDGFTAWSHLLSGNDTITGTNSDDRSIAGVSIGNDTYNMLGGDDDVQGNAGDDRYFGGDGFDVLSFSDTHYTESLTAFRGINLNVNTGRVIDCWGNTDTLSGFERYEGSRFNDIFTGSDARDFFRGLRGRDTFYGGADQDRVEYRNDFFSGGRFGIVVDLETGIQNGMIRGQIRDGFGNLDITYDIERVVGTRFNDVFVGSTENNHFWGGEGLDRFDGGAGYDGLRFSQYFTDRARTGVTVDLARATGQVINDGFGNTETAIGFEYVEGSDLNDTLRGDANNNSIEGGFGADTMTGRGGSDDYFWFTDDMFGQGDVITDFTATGNPANIDKVTFEVGEIAGLTSTLRLVNGTAATTNQGTFIFNAANDTLFWDADGTGAGAAQAIVRLINVAALSAANFEIYS